VKPGYPRVNCAVLRIVGSVLGPKMGLKTCLIPAYYILFDFRSIYDHWQPDSNVLTVKTKPTIHNNCCPFHRNQGIVGYMEGSLMKPLVIQEIGTQLKGTSTDEALTLINDYFSQIVWSFEKQEWESMSDIEKRLFVECAIKTESKS